MPPSDSPSPFSDPKPGWGSHHVIAGRFYFLGPADGPREQDLKSILLAVLKNNFRVSATYLAKIQYLSQQQPTLALCVKTIYPDDDDQVKLTERLFDLYASMYKKGEYMDMVSLDPRQEALLLTVGCKPFYERKDRIDKPPPPA